MSHSSWNIIAPSNWVIFFFQPFYWYIERISSAVFWKTNKQKNAILGSKRVLLNPNQSLSGSTAWLHHKIEILNIKKLKFLKWWIELFIIMSFQSNQRYCSLLHHSIDFFATFHLLLWWVFFFMPPPHRFSGRRCCEIAVSNLLFLTFNFIILCICQMDPSSHRFINLLCLSHAHTSSDLLLSNLYLKREDLCVDGGEERSSVLSSVETT